ncbi:hypothetical protein BIW11_00815 [Tropilaelaps mercedesae]|uniref:Spaetzle domain-containing protein n=1 Tax=Tropilaelaps mercedesae TaxID=418985 RepID=A0A1V9XNT9_9ACAR|nr:hypothetical protein BIW11_00815 [Tropilaelaps mercedesae]
MSDYSRIDMRLASLPSQACLLVLYVVICLLAHESDAQFRPGGPYLSDPQLEQGYYSFIKAEDYEHPPKVRKPPYHRANFRCNERLVDGKLSPRDTLCGDLNKGVIPMNPMGQRPISDPYPFELIKNKTLEFLSRSLPFLKAQKNLPKVARFGGTGPILGHMPVIHSSSATGPGYRFKRSVSNAFNSSSTVLVNNHGGSDHAAMELKTNPVPDLKSALSRENIHRMLNATVNGLCQNAQGTLCSVMIQLQRQRSGSSAAMLNTLTGLLNLAKAPQISNKVQNPETSSGSPSTATNILNVLSYAGEILNAVNQDSTTPAPIVTRSPLSQVLSALTGASGSSSANPSPIVQVLDLMTSESSPVKLLANMYSNSNRYKKQSDESSEKMYVKGDKLEQSSRSGSSLPPTPCPSMEEYVTPVYARNYQGVWKYVVQIPQEGYLTQTIQQTTCMSQTCDFVENGLCHESPRWVSLLVAEIFYPDAIVPSSPGGGGQGPSFHANLKSGPPRPPPHLPPHHPSFAQSYNQLSRAPPLFEKPVAGPQPSPSKLYPVYQRPVSSLDRLPGPPPVEDFHNFQQYLQRRVAHSHGFRLRKSKRNAQDSEDEDTIEGKNYSTLPKSSSPKKTSKCDGYDHVGCFVVRMYYDWFLVNGSCKCWKPNGKTQAKHLFGGKR